MPLTTNQLKLLNERNPAIKCPVCESTWFVQSVAHRVISSNIPHDQKLLHYTDSAMQILTCVQCQTIVCPRPIKSSNAVRDTYLELFYEERAAFEKKYNEEQDRLNPVED